MIDKQQYELVLGASKKEIDMLVEDEIQIEVYTKHRNMLERSIMTRMRANNFDELGKVRIDQVKVFDEIEVGKLLGLFLNEELAKSIVVSVDIEKTEKNLKERYGFTDVAIAPLIKILKEKLTVVKERLVVK
jgi:predicted RNA-binding protein (virulence factor B family)